MPTFENREALSSIRDKLNDAILLAEATAVDLEIEKGQAALAASQAQGYADAAQAAAVVAEQQSWETLSLAEYEALPVKETNKLYLIL